MFRLIKILRDTYCLEMNVSDAKDLLNYIECTINKKPTCELNIVHLKKGKERIKKFIIVNSEADSFEMANEHIKIGMCKENFDYFQYKLQDDIENKHFYPVEPITLYGPKTSNPLKGKDIDLNYHITGY